MIYLLSEFSPIFPNILEAVINLLSLAFGIVLNIRLHYIRVIFEKIRGWNTLVQLLRKLRKNPANIEKFVGYYIQP